MDVRLLTYFVTVVEEGTVSAAADELHMTQPALSRQIRSLEHSIGLQLFQRRAGRLHLTSEGNRFLETARSLLRHHRQAEQMAAQLARGALDSLVIASPSTTLTDVVAPFVATFAADDPVPSVRESPLGTDLHEAASASDLVITPEVLPEPLIDEPPAQLSHLKLVDLPVWAYVPAEHRWSGQSEVSLVELVTETLVLPTLQFKARQVLEAALDEAQVRPAHTVESEYSQVAQALAAAGRGAAVLTDDPRYDLHPLRIRNPSGLLQIQLTALWRTEHPAAKQLLKLAHRLKEFSQRRYPH